ncbi:Tetratricopeptide repeat protein [Planctomycetes bacterium CA13]|uniref:Tetratricopeptide repeat protein n=1 Tax=Novipirellula herctigrandis TaxID=2527986 RepID=A0A5C5YNN6_9BACT|nr:Tetratricopeptide repeat protein [Planctomycetes bacterium CA13]
MSNSEKPADSTSRSRGADESNPMDGGRWRPVRPDELLRKNPQIEKDQVAPEGKVQRHRRQELEHHIRSSPTDIEAYRELAEIYREEERPQEAARVLKDAVELFPNESVLLWELEEAKLARSLQQYREFRDLASRLKTSEVERELKRSQDDWAFRRIEVCKARLERDPTMLNLNLVLAEAYHDSDQPEKAIEELTDLVKIDEYSPHAYLLMGRCLLELGKDVEAMSALRAAGTRRAVVSPLPIRVAALRLLCDTAEKLGIEMTLSQYSSQLSAAEKELAKQTAK